MTIQVRNPCNLQQVFIGIMHMIDSGNLLPPALTAASISGGSSLDPAAAEFSPVTVTSKAVATGAGVVPEESQSK